MENNEKEYQQQLLEGASQIVEKAYQIAEKAGILLDSCEWDNGQKIADRSIHTLTITSGGKSAEGEFLDDWLADYPGKVGTEKANTVLREMIRLLS